MTNSNCLEGIRCPSCGQEERFFILGGAQFEVTDDGSEAVGDHEWGDDSATRCPDCDHTGSLKDFRIPQDIPPDPEGMNDKRAGWAATALKAFQDETGTDDGDALTDLLANLMHWCDRDGSDFTLALSRAREHYEAETAGEAA